MAGNGKNVGLSFLSMTYFAPNFSGWPGTLCLTYFTILFKIITHMKLLFSNFLRDYSHSLQGLPN